MPDRYTRSLVALLMLALALLSVRDLSRLGSSLPWHKMDDFPDFYCAGWAIDAKRSPYTYEPLHTCEHSVNSGGRFRAEIFSGNAGLAIPAPLPPYDFPPYMALALLPPASAAKIDAVAILAAVALTALTLALLGLPFEVAAAALVLSTAYTELNTGQFVPFSLLALVLCGLALARGKDSLAGVFAVLTAMEPSIGVPVIFAILCFVPRARTALALGAAILASVALFVVGAAALEQYANAVLPAQASAEIHFPYQYSLAYLLAFVGLPSKIAQLAGTISYFLLIVIGLWLGPRLARNLGKRELLVFVPALCATIGGTYLHPEELCFALPALLVLAMTARGTARAIFAFALCILAVPWLLVWGTKQLFAVSLFVCSVILVRLQIRLPVTLAVVFGIALVIYAFELRPPHLAIPAPSHAYPPSALVQDAWRDYAEARSTRDQLWLAIKLPTWVALVGCLAVAARPRRGW